MSYTFYSAFRDGIRLKYSPAQEMAFKKANATFLAHQCIRNEEGLATKSKSEEEKGVILEEEDENEEDEEDDEDDDSSSVEDGDSQMNTKLKRWRQVYDIAC